MAQPVAPIETSNPAQAKQLPEINTRVHRGRKRGSSNSNIDQPYQVTITINDYAKIHTTGNAFQLTL